MVPVVADNLKAEIGTGECAKMSSESGPRTDESSWGALRFVSRFDSSGQPTVALVPEDARWQLRSPISTTPQERRSSL